MKPERPKQNGATGRDGGDLSNDRRVGEPEAFGAELRRKIDAMSDAEVAVELRKRGIDPDASVAEVQARIARFPR